MAKSYALLLSAALLAAPAGHAESVVVRAGWDKARSMLAQGEYRPRIALELKSPKRVTLTQDRGEFHPRQRKEVELKPGKWIKGKLNEATSEGLQLVYRQHEISFPREDISRIRLVPLKADRTKNRRVGISGGIAAGILAGVLVAKVSACSGSECSPGGFFFMLGVTAAAVTFGFYKLGGRADRGYVMVVLEESTANNPLVPAQASGSSPARQERASIPVRQTDASDTFNTGKGKAK